MRDLEVLSTAAKRISVRQDDDVFSVLLSVHEGSFILDLSLEEAGELEAALAQLVEHRRQEVAPRSIEVAP